MLDLLVILMVASVERSADGNMVRINTANPVTFKASSITAWKKECGMIFPTLAALQVGETYCFLVQATRNDKNKYINLKLVPAPITSRTGKPITDKGDYMLLSLVAKREEEVTPESVMPKP